MMACMNDDLEVSPYLHVRPVAYLPFSVFKPPV